MFDFSQIAINAPWFVPTLAFGFGLAIGSFLNVCIYRIPKGESVVSPGSHCGCGKPIEWRDNLPVLGWLLLRGRARCCGQKFSIRYPAVELLIAVLFMLSASLFPLPKALAVMVLVFLLVGGSLVDVDHMIIPDIFTVGGMLGGVILSMALPALQAETAAIPAIASARAAVDSILGGFVGAGLVVWVAVLGEAALRKEVMGFGDVKLLAAIGAFVGWKGAVFTFFGGAVVGTIWFAMVILWGLATGRKATLAPKFETAEGKEAEAGVGAQMSFGPSLSLAALLYVFWLYPYVDRYFSTMRSLA